MDMINITKQPNASPVYVLDRRGWQGRHKLQHHVDESPARLSSILTEVFKKSPYIKRVILNNKDFSEFQHDASLKKPLVAVFYKVIDSSNGSLDAYIMGNKSFYPQMYLVVRQHFDDASLSCYSRIEKMVSDKAHPKPIVFTEMKSIDEVLIMANQMIMQHYKARFK